MHPLKVVNDVMGVLGVANFRYAEKNNQLLLRHQFRARRTLAVGTPEHRNVVIFRFAHFSRKAIAILVMQDLRRPGPRTFPGTS